MIKFDRKGKMIRYMRITNKKSSIVKKISKALFITVSACLLFAGCTLKDNGKDFDNSTENDSLSIVCTVFAEYDWLKNITDGADGIELSLITDTGADLHSYQPSAKDIVKITESDMLVYVGGESDTWAYEALAQSENKNNAVNLMELLNDGVKTEQTTSENGEALPDNIAGGSDHDDHDHENESDEHVWLSLKNAMMFTEKLAEKLCELDPDQAEIYTENAGKYVQELKKLHEEYESAVSALPHKAFVIADRFPFRYLADDYGLDYYAAFPGCSTETDADFDTVIFLAGKVDELGLSHVAVTESSDGAVAKAVIENSKSKNVATVVIDSMQSVDRNDIENGTTYISVMRSNLEALRTALS